MLRGRTDGPGKSFGREVARVYLEAVPTVPTAERLPPITERKYAKRLKLVNMAKLVQEEFSRSRGGWAEPDASPNRDPIDPRSAQAPSPKTRQQPPSSQNKDTQLGKPIQQGLGHSIWCANHLACEPGRKCHWPSWVLRSIATPSVATMMVPSSSVRNTCAPLALSDRSTSGDG